MQPDEEIQYAPRSRPVSFYDNYKDVSPCVVISTMSVDNLNQVYDGTPAMPQSNNNNINSSNNNNNNRVSSAVSAGNVSKITNAKVSAAVSTGNIGRVSRGDKEKELGRAPSMANCLSTTVPVNLAASQIAGRHTPTRNSLRHSRMIMMHRTGGNRPEKFLASFTCHRRLAQCLVSLQTILGIAIISLSLWLLLWSPHLPVVDIPYWSGMPLLLSGSFGICLLCCFKKEYPGRNSGLCLSVTKVVSVFLAVLATIACTGACIFSAIHLIRLTRLECTPPQVLNTTCTCRPTDQPPDSLEGVVRYADLNCPEVEGVLTILLIFSSTCNGLGALLAASYGYLHWITRQWQPRYTKVRTNAVHRNNAYKDPSVFLYSPTNL